MDSKNAYVSSIPKEAEERVVKRYRGGAKHRAEYYLDGQHVGSRFFSSTGQLEWEISIRNGVWHGIQYRWYESGELFSLEPYENGVPHGTAYEWAEGGTLLGTCIMDRGTGIDLWWEDCSGGTVTLAEAHSIKEGKWHGYVWWLNADQKSVWWEAHYEKGLPHGIERQWNSQDRLRRGYPRYYVHGKQVTKAQYLRAATKDPSLPPFRVEDNAPHRMFPPEIARHLGLRG